MTIERVGFRDANELYQGVTTLTVRRICRPHVLQLTKRAQTERVNSYRDTWENKDVNNRYTSCITKDLSG